MATPAVQAAVAGFHTSPLPIFQDLRAVWDSAIGTDGLRTAACLQAPDGSGPAFYRLPHCPVKAQRFIAEALSKAERRDLQAPPGGARAPAATTPDRQRRDAERRVAARARGNMQYGARSCYEWRRGPDVWLTPFTAKVAFAIKYLGAAGHLGDPTPAALADATTAQERAENRPAPDQAVLDAAVAHAAHGGHQHTHKAVGLVFARMLRAMGYQVVPEVPGLHATDGRRPDFVTVRSDGTFLAFDHSVTHTTSRTNLGANASWERSLGAAAAVEAKKDSRYWELVRRQAELIPFALETTGGWGALFANFFKEWVVQAREAERAQGGSGWETTHMMQLWQQRISAAMYGSIAQRVRARYMPHHGGAVPAPGHAAAGAA